MSAHQCLWGGSNVSSPQVRSEDLCEKNVFFIAGFWGRLRIEASKMTECGLAFQRLRSPIHRALVSSQ